jgi:hypothetical protein
VSSEIRGVEEGYEDDAKKSIPQKRALIGHKIT